MASSVLIKNAQIINEGNIYREDIYIQNGLFHTIGKNINRIADLTVDASNPHLYLLPGIIDDQVHFREPGLTHKADLYTESRAAAAGGITSFMEMPNTKPQTLTLDLLEQKFERASTQSAVNYSFFLGASHDNIEEIKKVDPTHVCGVKVFMGSSTGNMLVDDEEALDQIFKYSPMLVATHCEKEEIIQHNIAHYREEFGEAIPIDYHPIIRSENACFASSQQAVALAETHNTRLHVLHISTQKELSLFNNTIPLSEKRITAEVCIHHLWFTDQDYQDKGVFIKWNPAVKKMTDRQALRKGLLSNKLDIVATDHAPHTLEEKKAGYYEKTPSGAPMVQHALPVMLELVQENVFSLEKVVEKMAHAPAVCFQLSKRGFIREGYFADFVLVNMENPWEVRKDNLLYKCGWSPLEGSRFRTQIEKTFVNGQLVYQKGEIDNNVRGMRLQFDRP